jgi:sugar lactone lactonase YvrE
VHHGKVVRRRPDGMTSDFARLAGLAPLGLAVDAPRGRLWTVAADLPQLARRAEASRGSTFLLAFDLSDGRELARVAPPGGPGQALNDLIVAGDGTVFVSDGQTGAVWALAPGAAALEPILPPGELRSAGGLALDASGDRLLVADWSRGLAMVERHGGRWWRVTTPADLFPVGIDGLVAHRGGFVAIQNGFLPSRVLRFELAPDGTAVTRFTVLERAHPDHVEPTLGVVVGDDLYYVANSQWEEFGEDGRPRAPERLAAPAVIRLPLR